MKLYILRHQIRGNDPTFYSSLLPEGMGNSEHLKYTLENLNINLIFSSPFIRCLQTILPYYFYSGIKINREFGLYEEISFPLFDKYNYKKDIQSFDYEYYILNHNYKSFINIDDVYPENTINRILQFKKYLIDTYKNTNYNILLVSHQTPINYFLERPDIRFPMGTLFEVVDLNNNVVINIPY